MDTMARQPALDAAADRLASGLSFSASDARAPRHRWRDMLARLLDDRGAGDVVGRAVDEALREFAAEA